MSNPWLSSVKSLYFFLTKSKLILLDFPIFFLIERILFGKRLNDLKENGETDSIIKIWTTYYLVFYVQYKEKQV